MIPRSLIGALVAAALGVGALLRTFSEPDELRPPGSAGLC
jgi:hypothetical protein